MIWCTVYMVVGFSPQCDVSRSVLAGCTGMRQRGGRDFNPDSHLDLVPPSPTVSWLPGVLSRGVRLRLRLDRRDGRGRDCWHLVDTGRSRRQLGGDRGAARPLTPTHRVSLLFWWRCTLVWQRFDQTALSWKRYSPFFLWYHFFFLKYQWLQYSFYGRASISIISFCIH